MEPTSHPPHGVPRHGSGRERPAREPGNGGAVPTHPWLPWLPVPFRGQY